AIGTFTGVKASPEGKLISAAEWEKRHGEWLPTEEDRAFVHSLMKPVTEIGKIAGWIAPPARGINGQPFDFDYVQFH
ncbi:MAG: benzoyl-CoA 2,3-epoxidase subunit BoxB, partial [Alphaproteobacteria bacterium]|nr:benzoyl-CoA 2,3-epoxidase subunit BoxB [Alphaproteobacteria bacterium]